MGCPRACCGYPHAAGAAARAVHVATQGLGAGGAERERDRAEGRGVRAAAQAAVRGGVREARDAMARGRGRRAGRRARRRGWARDDRPAVGAGSPTTRSTWRSSPTSPRWWGTSPTSRSGGTSLWAVARDDRDRRAGRERRLVVTRGLAAHRVPWGNMYEYSVLLALLVVAGYLIVVEGILQGPHPRRVRVDVLGLHDGDRRVVLLRGSRAARAGAQLVLDQDPRASRRSRVPRCSRWAAASSRSCT